MILSTCVALALACAQINLVLLTEILSAGTFPQYIMNLDLGQAWILAAGRTF